MSRKIMMIELEPGRRMQKEAFVSASMVCPYCGGRGYFLATEYQPWKTVCPDCKGTGEVIAFVTIDWKPNKK